MMRFRLNLQNKYGKTCNKIKINNDKISQVEAEMKIVFFAGCFLFLVYIKNRYEYYIEDYK